MESIDLKGEYRQMYRAGGRGPELLEVPALPYLMIDGRGAPDSPGFDEAVQALYAMAYGLKFEFKKHRDIEYPVMPLEGLWSSPDRGASSTPEARAAWTWTLMIMVMYLITPKDVEAVRASAARKKDLPALPRVRLDTLDEGLSAQIVHVGPYSEEPATVARLHAFIAEQGYAIAGPHHEVYLNDPSRTAPEKLKTILRYPVRKAD